MSEFEAKIVASLDTADAEKQLKNLTEKEHEVKLKTDFNEKDTQKQFDETLKKTQKKTAKKPLEFEVKANSNDLIQLSDTANKLFSMFTGNRNVLDFSVDHIQEAIGQLKELNTALVEIDKTSNLTQTGLRSLADNSFDEASKYGAIVQDYMNSAGEFAKAGYSNLDEITEIAMLTQISGNVTSDMANKYIIATDAAYKFGGSVKELTKVIDGANNIANKNSVEVDDLSKAATVSASFASQAGVSVEQLTAAEGTMAAVTKRSGSEMGRAFRSILLNLQQVSGEFDGEVIDEEQLEKVEKRCHSLGVELEYMKDGVATLRNPMDILKELSDVFNSLPDDSADKQGLISDIGGKYHANALSSLLGNWELYEKMLSDFNSGTGSAMNEAMKTADSWEGRLNALSNTWLEFVNNFIQADAMKGGITFLDNMISAMDILQDKRLFIPSMLSAIMGLQTAFTGKGIDIGHDKNGKLDIGGNLFGIDLSAMKESKGWKEHFVGAEAEISRWNKEISSGQVSLEDFGGEFVKQNKNFKSYISGLDGASASLEGYKQHLTDTGVEFEKTFSAKSVLANAATGLLVGAGIELSLAALTKVADELIFKQQRAIEKAEGSQSDYSSTVSELESLNSELDSTKSRIEELQALKDAGTITFAEDNELTRLQNQNKELERQIALTEKAAEQKSLQAANDAKEALKVEKTQDMTQTYETYDKNGLVAHQHNKQTDIITATQNEIAELKKLKQERQDLLNDDIDDSKQTEDFDSLDSEIEKYSNAISSNIEALSTIRASFEDGNGLMRDGLDQEAQNYYKAITDIIDGFNNIDLSPAEQELNSLDSFFSSTTGNAIGDYLNNIVAESGNAEDALNKFKELGLSLDDIGVSQDSFLRYFQNVARSAEEAKESISTLGTTLSDVDAAFESENQDANWAKFADYATQAKELAKQGKWGTDDLQKSIEWVLPKFDVEKELKKNDDFEYVADVYESKWDEAKKRLKRYFDADNPLDSATNFQNDLISKGLLKEDKTGLTGTFDNTAKAAEKMNLSLDATEALLRNLESYGFEWDDVMFSGEGITRYENALNNIKSLRDSMDEGDTKDRLDRLIDGEGGWEEQYKEFQNDLSKLTSEDQIVHIEFEYDLAQLDAEIAELEKNVANSDGKDIKENASLLAKKQARRDTAEKYLTEERGMKISDEYKLADKAISELQNKLKQSGLSEDQKVEFQAEISNLTDLQNNLLNAFDDSGMSWDNFIKTDTFDKFVSDTKSKIEDLNGESVDVEGDIDTSKINSKLEGVLSNDGKTITMKVDASTDQIQAQLNQLQNGQKMVFNANVDGKQTGVSATKDETGKITYTAVIDGVEKILTQNGTVNYTIGSQEEPKDKNSNVNYTKGEQENPEDKNTIVNYDKGKQEKPDKQKTTVDYNKGKQQNPDPKSAGVNYKKSGQEAPSDKTANVFYKAVGSTAGSAISKAVKTATGAVKLNGTAHKEGTVKDKDVSSPNTKSGFLSKIGNGIRRAFASGTLEDDSFIKEKWRTKKSETALTGEEGQELVATRDNTWYTVGDNGAEFAHIPAGSVVFNAKQTEELLKNGSIKSRGKALLSGTIARGKAFLSGTAYASGNGGKKLSGSSTKKKSSSKSKSSSKKSSSKKKSSKKSSKDSKKFKETFDWIEVAINRIERAIETLDLKANSVYRSWSSRNANLKSEISNVSAEITKQQQGYNRYIKEANSVGLASKWKKKVQNGTIDISTVKDEKLAEKIKEYQQW